MIGTAAYSQAVATRQRISTRATSVFRNFLIAARSRKSEIASIKPASSRLIFVRSQRLAPSNTKKQLRSLSLEASADASVTNEGQAVDYFETDKRPVILFDGVCNMCNGGVNFCLDWDTTGKLRFAALQSEAGKALLIKSGRRPDDISSIVYVDEERSLLKSDAVIKIAEHLKLPLPAFSAFAIFFPAFFRDFVYDIVAENRYEFMGKQEACRLSDPNFDDRFVQ